MSQLRTPYVRQAQCSTLPPAPSSAVRTFPPKVPGKKGKSQLDWVRLLSSGAKLVRSSRPRALTRAEVRKHSAPDDCWMVLSGKVYDMTPFMEYHPGGASELMRAAGEDGTALYNEIHPWVNLDFLASKLLVGFLEDGDDGESKADSGSRTVRMRPSAAPAAPTRARPSRPVAADKALDEDAWQSFRLLRRTKIGANSFMFRFILPPGSVTGLEAGQHLLVQIPTDDGAHVERPFTPVSLPWESQSFDLYVKCYEHGKAGKFFRNLRVGMAANMKGPRGAFRYNKGVVSTNGGKTFRIITRMCMLAGGSGLTPLLQLIRVALGKSMDSTTMQLVYFNHDRESIMAEDELRELAAGSGGRLRVTFVTSVPCEARGGGWGEGQAGRLSGGLLAELVDKPAKDHAVLWCGPPGFNASAREAAEALGFESELQFEF